MKQILFSLIILITLFAFSALQAANRVEIILDVSGSMGALAGGEKKIDAAKKAVASSITAIPPNAQVGLRLYGHRVPNNQKAESCKDSQLVIPFGPVNQAQFQKALNEAMPLGQTPIAFSLQEAAKDFGPAKDEEAVIILVSDGAETCGGDPVAVARDLIAKGFKIKINTIGFDVDASTRAQLEAISKATGGTYMDAKDTAGLSKSLQEMTQKSLVVEKEKAVYGDETQGGDSYETAVAIPLNKEFRLNHHQKKNDFDYFYVDLKAGQKLSVTLKTGEKGVDIREGQAKENNNPYAGVQIHDSNRQRIIYDNIIGSRNQTKVLGVPTGHGQEGRYYVLVGSTYDDQHKDNPFKVEVIDLFDAGSQQDAGSSEATALPIQSGEYKNYLHPNDKVDYFKFTASPEAVYQIKARPENKGVLLRITLFDADGVKLSQARAPNQGAAVKIENFKPEQGGTIFAVVKNIYSTQPETSYQMSLAEAGGTEVAKTEEEAPPAPPKEAAPAPPPEATAPKEAKTASPKKTAKAGSASPQGAKEVYQLVRTLPFLEKIKFYGMYMGIPLVAGWLIGMIWGYIKGRKTGKRKALAQK